MLKKIFNRKYYKAIEEIEAEIEMLRGREDYYKAELRMGLEYNKAADAVALVRWYRDQREALERTLIGIRTKLH